MKVPWANISTVTVGGHCFPLATCRCSPDQNAPLVHLSLGRKRCPQLILYSTNTWSRCAMLGTEPQRNKMLREQVGMGCREARPPPTRSKKNHKPCAEHSMGIATGCSVSLVESIRDTNVKWQRGME